MVYKSKIPEKPEFLKNGGMVKCYQLETKPVTNITWKEQDTKVYLCMEIRMFEKRSRWILRKVQQKLDQYI